MRKEQIILLACAYFLIFLITTNAKGEGYLNFQDLPMSFDEMVRNIKAPDIHQRKH